MAIIVNQQDNRSELQKRIAADLSEKAKKKHDPIGDRPDGVEDSAYVQGTQSTGKLAWVWILLIAGIVVAAVILFMISGNKA